MRYQELLRAARVGKDIQIYDEAARQPAGFEERNRLAVILTEEEKIALRNEKDVAFSEKGMLAVIAHWQHFCKVGPNRCRQRLKRANSSSSC